MSSTRRDHTAALYAKDQTVVLVTADQWEQEEWYLAVKKLIEEEWRDEEWGEGLSKEDDGYCTLPAAPFFREVCVCTCVCVHLICSVLSWVLLLLYEVWPVSVKPRGLGCSRSLTGEGRRPLSSWSGWVCPVSCRQSPSRC